MIDNNTKVGLEKVADYIGSKIKDVLIAQGHKLTGNIYRDKEVKIRGDISRIIVEGWYPYYARFVNDGVRADKIPFSPGSGKKRSKYIEALIRYAKKRGMLEPKSAAFAIAHKQKKEGMPTKGSYRYSKIGSRRGFINIALYRARGADKMISELMSGEMSSKVESYFKKGFRRV